MDHKFHLWGLDRPHISPAGIRQSQISAVRLKRTPKIQLHGLNKLQILLGQTPNFTYKAQKIPKFHRQGLDRPQTSPAGIRQTPNFICNAETDPKFHR